MKFKRDENLSPSLAELFTATGHDAHSVVQQALVTLDLDFSNILAYPPADSLGLVVLRLSDQAHVPVPIRLLMRLTASLSGLKSFLHVSHRTVG